MTKPENADEGFDSSGCSSSEVERVYQDFWKPLVERDGIVDMEQVKKELFDFWQVMDRVPKVYCHITGGQVSKILTDPEVVNALADDYYGDQESYCGHCACQSCYDAKRKHDDHW